MNMNYPSREVLINNFSNLEDYLKLDVYGEERLRYLRLDLNIDVKGVNELLKKIPNGFRPEVLKKFYEETGLKIQAQIHQQYELTRYDKDGRYPREDAVVWNQDFMENASGHPEWLEPQEEPDIIVRYVFPMKEEYSENVKVVVNNMVLVF